mgnify:FL=1
MTNLVEAGIFTSELFADIIICNKHFREIKMPHQSRFLGNAIE